MDKIWSGVKIKDKRSKIIKVVKKLASLQARLRKYFRTDAEK